jgi:O-antigen/teichoic acid export membrane protein
MVNRLTGDESTFQKPKSRAVALFAYKAAADTGAKLALFVVTVVAARRLPPSAFGVFALGSTLGWIAAVAADFGMQLHVARAVARSRALAATLLSRWWRIRLWSTAGALALIVVGLTATQPGASVSVPIAVLAIVYALGGLLEFLNYFFRGLSRSDIESSLTIWQRAGTVVCGLAALALRPTAEALAIALLIPVVVTLLVSVRLATRLASAAERSDVAQDFSPAFFRRDVAPIGAGILLSALYFRIDVFLVQLWAGTESVALYNAVFRVIEGLRLFPAAALAVALPELCRARTTRPLITVSLLIISGAILVTAIGWFAAQSIVVLLFGEAYSGAAPAFRILLLSFPLLSLNYALTHQLIGWDRQRAYAGICAMALVANLAMNARLLPVLSIEGAAWATLGTELVVTAGCAAVLLNRSRWLPASLAIADPRLG